MRIIAVIAGIVISSAVLMTNNSSTEAQTNVTNDKEKAKIVIIKRGDTLEKIAKKNNTTYPRLFDANKKIKDADLIFINDKIRIPDPSEKIARRSVVVVNSQHKKTEYSPVKKTVVSNSGASGSSFERLAACESGGNWSINTGNGYSGGLQFSQATWQSVGGSGSPHNASKAEQIKRGKILQQRSGWGQWPACSAKLGLR